MPTDYAIHSDFLVHWTGKDLDSQYHPDWPNSDKSRTDKPLSRAYLKRLHSILKYGLWLTEEDDLRFLVDGDEVVIPRTPKVCFTELKLSESRIHAKRYGRLGIGVKRPYLFTRLGRPLAYFGFHENIQNDPFLSNCAADFKDKKLLNFFKPMNSTSTLNYDLYGESEWRILFFQELLDKQLLVDPRDDRNTEEHAFFKSLTSSEQKILKYCAPLNGWFQLIIYPSLSVKNMAQQESSTKFEKRSPG